MVLLFKFASGCPNPPRLRLGGFEQTSVDFSQILLASQTAHAISYIIPLSAGIPVKSHSQFIPNSTGQQCNLEEAVRFEPNPPRAVWDSVFSKSIFNVFLKSTKFGMALAGFRTRATSPAEFWQIDLNLTSKSSCGLMQMFFLQTDKFMSSSDIYEWCEWHPNFSLFLYCWPEKGPNLWLKWPKNGLNFQCLSTRIWNTDR